MKNTHKKKRHTEFSLIFKVKINLDGENPKEIESNLEAIAVDALNWGNVTGDGPATVEEYSIKIEKLS